LEFHTSPCRATIFSVRCGPEPPIQIGGCGFWTGFGSAIASVSV